MKRVDLVGRVNAEFRVDALNVFNQVNFARLSVITIPTTGVNTNRSSGSNPVSYETTALITGNQARVVQLVSRIRW